MSGLDGLPIELKELAAGYVLDELDPQETQRLEVLLQENPLLRQEVRLLQATLGLMAADVPAMMPPPGLRDRTLQAFSAASSSAVSSSSGTATVVSPAIAAGDQRGQSFAPKRAFSVSKWLGLLGLLALAALAFDNFQLRRQLSLAQQATPDALAQMLQRPKSRLVTLTANPGTPSAGTPPAGTAAGGTLLFTPGQWQQVVLSIQDLPPLEGDQVYRLWLTLANDQTLFCGEFKTNAQGRVSVQMQPTQQPPQGVKATGLVVTRDRTGAPIELKGDRLLTGTI
jgi:hypothetical protein